MNRAVPADGPPFKEVVLVNTSSTTSAGMPSAPALQQAFLMILPRLKEHGRIYFRDLRNSERREEAVSEMLAIAWSWFVRLAQRGKDAALFPSVLATYAARAVRSGRRLCGQEKAKDVLSPRAQQRRGFCVGPLPEGHGVEDSVFAEALLDNTTTPIPEQVQFRLDFPRWRSSRNARDQRLIDDLMLDERSSCMARKYGLSRPRVSELRRQMFEDWNRFCNATPADIRSTRGLAAVCS